MNAVAGAIEVEGEWFAYSHTEAEGELVETFELLVALPSMQGIEVLRQGGRCDGGWGVDVELHTHTGAITPAEARRWARALLAAAALAEQLEEQEMGAAS